MLDCVSVDLFGCSVNCIVNDEGIYKKEACSVSGFLLKVIWYWFAED